MTDLTETVSMYSGSGDSRFFATAARDVEGLLADEIAMLADEARAAGETVPDGAVHAEHGGVAFEGPLSLAYRVCLWSRVAQRVLLPLAAFAAADADELYAGVAAIDWSGHLGVDDTLAVDFAAVKSHLAHTQFGAQRVKDAIVDQFRERTGVRPSVDLVRPVLRVNVFVQHDEATVSVDLSGDGLHRRGYREPGAQVAAPLKETLAAAILLRAGWPAIAARGGSVVDPLCGSATLPIEAALIACDIAPGALRDHWGFLGWKGHDAAAWSALVVEAGRRREAALARLRKAGALPLAFGYDRDRRAIALARDNVRRAGLEGVVHVERRELSEFAPPPRKPAPIARGNADAPPERSDEPPERSDGPAGLVVANPPYGERLGAGSGTSAELIALYELLGERLRTGFTGWKAAIIVGDLEMGKHLGLRAKRTNRLMNGPLECRLLRIDLEPRWFVAPRAGAGMGGTGRASAVDGGEAKGSAKSVRQAARAATADDTGAVALRSAASPNEDPASSPSSTPALTPAGEQFANRLRKNVRHRGRVMRRAGVTCYRVYDADLPDFAVAVDLYERWVHVQEYAAPPEIEPEKAAQRLAEALRIVPEVLGVAPGDVVLKVRKRQRGKAQYERQAKAGVFHEVHEGDCRFLVNFTDYLDTGLFPQGREVRRLIGGLARGRRFLNLFGYTGAASVAAAKGGAATTTTVDLSPHYLDWARRNFELNKMKPARNAAVEADVLEWITRPLYDGAEAPGEYDLIYLDPPTFSNSKKMGRSTFEAQRDHADLIAIVCRRLLAPGGIMLFATNFRRFKLDAEKLGDFHLEDLSRATLPRDYERSARTHNVWKITAKR